MVVNVQGANLTQPLLKENAKLIFQRAHDTLNVTSKVGFVSFPAGKIILKKKKQKKHLNLNMPFYVSNLLVIAMLH